MSKTEKKYTSLFENVLIWFGAGVSIAEILTGTYFAGLGLLKGLLAILIGHVIGCFLLALSGLIGGCSRKSSMETVKDSFGQRGGLFFALLNILQLLGWTSIMIYDGAAASAVIFGNSPKIWVLVIGALIILWILIGITNLGKLNTIAMTALFILTLILCKVIFFSGAPVIRVSEDSLSFGAAVELSVAMPLSWLPLISDYTREAARPVRAAVTGSVIYGLISCWMYFIGMGAALLTGESDIARIMQRAGLGVMGLIIIVFSTVTTTFLDAWSSGISSEAVQKKINGKYAAIGTTVLGTIGAFFFPMDDITDFLYLIGSVFAPMIAVQIADHFILKKAPSKKGFNIKNMIIWALGLILYRLFMKMDIPVGNTLPDMAATILMCLMAGLPRKKRPV